MDGFVGEFEAPSQAVAQLVAPASNLELAGFGVFVAILVLTMIAVGDLAALCKGPRR